MALTNEASGGVSGLEKLIFEHSPEDVDTRLRMLVAALRDGDEQDKRLPKDVYVQLIRRIFAPELAKARGDEITEDDYRLGGLFYAVHDPLHAYNLRLAELLTGKREYPVDDEFMEFQHEFEKYLMRLAKGQMPDRYSWLAAHQPKPDNGEER